MNKQSISEKEFLSLLRGGLWEKEVHLASYRSFDYKAIYRLSLEQSVLGLVTAGLEHVLDVQVPKEVILTFVGGTLQIEQRNRDMNQFLASLIGKMRRADIYTLLLKGQGVAQCYERPLWRSSGDIDLFLSNDNYEKAKIVLYPLAQSVENEFVYTKHQEMTISSWNVEIHGNLRGRLMPRIDKQLDSIQRETFYGGKVRSWMDSNMQVFLLEATNDAIYVFSHILQHFFKWGIGLRQICDWCRLLWKYRDSIDESTLKSRLRQMGLMSEWKTFASLAVDYLGMPSEFMPLYSPKDKWHHKAKRVLRIIMKSGNMGHNRDMSYIKQNPFLVRKTISLWQHTKQSFYHFRVFPLDSVAIWWYMFVNGIKIAVVGDK